MGTQWFDKSAGPTDGRAQESSCRLGTPTIWARGLGCVVCLGIVVSLHCRADVPRTGKAQDPPRTWGEVKLEISTAFDACWECAGKVIRDQPANTPFTFDGSGGGSVRPPNSVTAIVYDRHTADGPRNSVRILDIRVERDYFHELGRASSFRIVRNAVKDEGEFMLQGMITFFESKKWPYVIVDPKQDARDQKPADKKFNKESPP